MFFCEYFTKLLRVSISENICGELLLENEDLETLEIEIKLNAHETFRKRLGRLLNILCTFKLCLVSRKEFRKIWNYKYKYIEKPATSASLCIVKTCPACRLLNHANSEKDTHDFKLTLIFPGLSSPPNKLVMYPPISVAHCNTIQAINKL